MWLLFGIVLWYQSLAHDDTLIEYSLWASFDYGGKRKRYVSHLVD